MDSSNQNKDQSKTINNNGNGNTNLSKSNIDLSDIYNNKNQSKSGLSGFYNDDLSKNTKNISEIHQESEDKKTSSENKTNNGNTIKKILDEFGKLNIILYKLNYFRSK